MTRQPDLPDIPWITTSDRVRSLGGETNPETMDAPDETVDDSAATDISKVIFLRDERLRRRSTYSLRAAASNLGNGALADVIVLPTREPMS